jgi:hypothetical protein
MSRAVRFGLASCLLALSACQTPRSPSAPSPSAPPASSEEPAPGPVPGLPAESPLAAEAKWLAELFAGTPVQVSGERDGSVRLAVPMKYAFDAPAAAAPKPPLQAVLDKLAQSLKRQPAAKLQATAPAGAGSAERMAAIRTHLAGKGVPSWRFAAAGAPGNDQVLLRLVPPPGGLRRLDDNTLSPAAAGRVLPPTSSASSASASAR